MSIPSEIQRLRQNIAAAFAAVGNKGGKLPEAQVSGNLAAAIETIAGAGLLQSVTVTPSTSQQTVTPGEGFDGLEQVIVEAVPEAQQATPSISVSSSGLITATADQEEGYVPAGSKSATKQLTAQAAQTITPGMSDKTIASGRYLTGTQTIKGDSNLTASNIKSGVSIFGVNGSYSPVKRAEGSVTGNSTTGKTDAVELGWKPDIVIFTDFVYTASDGNKVYTCPVAVFTDAPTNNYLEVYGMGADNKEYYIYPYQLWNGFYVNHIYTHNGSGWVHATGLTLNYIAIKYK